MDAVVGDETVSFIAWSVVSKAYDGTSGPVQKCYVSEVQDGGRVSLLGLPKYLWDR